MLHTEIAQRANAWELAIRAQARRKHKSPSFVHNYMRAPIEELWVSYEVSVTLYNALPWYSKVWKWLNTSVHSSKESFGA